MTTITSKQQFSKVVNQINELNNDLLEPDPMAWGNITREEADDIFNDVAVSSNGTMHEEWGTKSFNLLHWIEHYWYDHY